MAGKNMMTLPVDVVLRIRDMYAERHPVKRWLPRWTHAQIAKELDTSPSTVARVVNREGAYAWVGGPKSMGEAMHDPATMAQQAAEAKASLERLQKLLSSGPPIEDKPDPMAQLDPELLAKAKAIEAQVLAQGLGNSEAKPLSNTHASGNSARRETEAQDGASAGASQDQSDRDGQQESS